MANKKNYKLDANSILNNLVTKIYYDDVGKIKYPNIDNIDYNAVDISSTAIIKLKNGRFFTITITTSDNYCSA